jgi:hypothetical protein
MKFREDFRRVRCESAKFGTVGLNAHRWPTTCTRLQVCVRHRVDTARNGMLDERLANFM